MQAVYFPKRILDVKKGDSFYIECNHDEYSLWFDMTDKSKQTRDPSNSIESFVNEAEYECTFERSLGITLVSRNRLAQLNDINRNEKFIALLKMV